jgi:hypothetical protein
MPVTTKAQLSAKSEDSANNVKPGMHESLAKLRNLLKAAIFSRAVSPLPAEPRFQTRSSELNSGGLAAAFPSCTAIYDYKSEKNLRLIFRSHSFQQNAKAHVVP